MLQELYTRYFKNKFVTQKLKEPPKEPPKEFSKNLLNIKVNFSSFGFATQELPSEEAKTQ